MADDDSAADRREVVVRRAPRQARAQRRVDALLDAAADLIAEFGTGRTTTNAIAARAGASVGSLYQFFPDKQAIIAALAHRYAAEFDALKDRIMSLEAADRPLPEMMRDIVEPIAAFFDANPAYPRVFSDTMESASPESAPEARLHDAVIARVEAMLARRFPDQTPHTRRAIATVQVHTVHAIMIASARLDTAARRALREELIRTLVSALQPFESAADA